MTDPAPLPRTPRRVENELRLAIQRAMRTRDTSEVKRLTAELLRVTREARK